MLPGQIRASSTEVIEKKMKTEIVHKKDYRKGEDGANKKRKQRLKKHLFKMRKKTAGYSGSYVKIW